MNYPPRIVSSKYFTFFFKQVCLSILMFLMSHLVIAQGFSETQKAKWLQEAEALKPTLYEQVKLPQTIIEIQKDTSTFFGYKSINKGEASSIYNKKLVMGDEIYLDFGEHMVGYVQVSFSELKSVADAPVRLKFTFGEAPYELKVSSDNYNGTLSKAWLQEEIVNVETFPTEIRLPRRVTFRYMKIEVLGSSQYSDFGISNIQCMARSSVDGDPMVLAREVSDTYKSIDEVSLRTLKACMQTVYEDGPKRDQRLWIGDMRLQALTNYATFKDYTLIKRCLYLLAGLSSDDGFITATLFEAPTPHRQPLYCLDYALLFSVSLVEYYEASQDKATALALWPAAMRQVEFALAQVNSDQVFIYPEESQRDWYLFFDWSDGLDKQVAMNGLTIYTIQKMAHLSSALGMKEKSKFLKDKAQQMKEACVKHLFNEDRSLFLSGKEKQISYASQVWMIIAGVTSQKEAQKVLKSVKASNQAIMPKTPYMYHHYLEALIIAGMHEEAKAFMVSYWGGMVKNGADTMWEVYDPEEPLFSPYGTILMNSLCHAWSCTPSYFLRAYPDIFK